MKDAEEEASASEAQLEEAPVVVSEWQQKSQSSAFRRVYCNISELHALNMHTQIYAPFLYTNT